MVMRIGVFGGTFDPIHLGHLIVAEQCREQAGLDEVRFLPAAHPPHKPQPVTSFAQRVEMLQLAVSGQPSFIVDEMENERPGPSYTADTLEEMHRRRPEAELCLILGADAVADLPRWYEPERICALATLLVVARPEGPPFEMQRLRGELGVAIRHEAIAAPLIGIASRDLRRRLTSGGSVRYQVARSVEAYIRDKGLYAADA